MRHVFIINPVAGRHSAESFIRREAESYFSTHGGEYAVRVTKAPMDAASIAREEAASGVPVRLYACGGDGTLYEVANGAFSYENAEIATVPTGSGNDFIRNFGAKSDFLDIGRLIEGDSVVIDMIGFGTHRAVNICTAGYDADVAYNLAKFKNIPFVNGGGAYILSVLYSLLKSIRHRFVISIDGGAPVDADFLLTASANGRWYGGGFQVAPLASLDDHRLDFVIIRAVSRLTFLRLVSRFRSGEHLTLTGIVRYLHGSSLRISSDRPFPINVDGECLSACDVEFKLIPRCLRFILPKGLKAGDVLAEMPAEIPSAGPHAFAHRGFFS